VATVQPDFKPVAGPGRSVRRTEHAVTGARWCADRNAVELGWGRGGEAMVSGWQERAPLKRKKALGHDRCHRTPWVSYRERRGTRRRALRIRTKEAGGGITSDRRSDHFCRTEAGWLLSRKHPYLVASRLVGAGVAALGHAAVVARGSARSATPLLVLGFCLLLVVRGSRLVHDVGAPQGRKEVRQKVIIRRLGPI
jgi:hypothetical protein